MHALLRCGPEMRPVGVVNRKFAWHGRGNDAKRYNRPAIGSLVRDGVPTSAALVGHGEAR